MTTTSASGDAFERLMHLRYISEVLFQIRVLEKRNFKYYFKRQE